MRRTLAAAAGALGLLLLWAVPAQAHAVLLHTTPGVSSIHATEPSRVALTFDENVSTPAFIVVTAPDGTRVKSSAVKVLNHTVSIDPTDVDQKGRYTVAWRVVSADGHPVGGTWHYDVTSGRAVKQVVQPDDRSFVQRHAAHITWGVLGAVAALALIIIPLRKARNDDA